jgi:uncharacterized repeat protein (TIGR03806 family)
MFLLAAWRSHAQTAFVNFNTVGEFTNNFNSWDNGNNGLNAGNDAFEESTNDGVGGSGGVAVYQSVDTTATYKTGSWNLATNGATIIASVLIYTDGQNSGDKTQLGVTDSKDNGLNSNVGIDFESFRFIPDSATDWPLFEQYYVSGAAPQSTELGAVTVQVGHWYKFVVAVTNTSGSSGNLSAGCALYDYGADGLTPGANLITFPTATSHAGMAVAQSTTVWPALRAFQNGGISAWDNFLVYTSNSLPVMTLALTNVVLASGTSATFNALADGPGAITYAWYTNNTLAAGATSATYTTPPVNSGFTNVMVVARNANGAVNSSATVSVIVPQPPQIQSAPATDIQSSSAILGGRVLSTGGVMTTVNLYYGTADGGTNAGAWAQGFELGSQTGAFSQTVALNPNTTYFFTVEAVNSAGTVWATPSLSFTTSNAPTAISFFDNGNNWTINQEGLTTAVISGNVLYGTTGGQNQFVTAWYNSQVNINGFTATFTYQDVGGSPGNNADGASFDLQESGTAYINEGNGGGGLAIAGLTPSADWEINIYNGNGIGILYNTDGNTGGYLPTGNVDVSSGDPINFTILYAAGGEVQEALVDTTTGDTFTTNYNIGDLTELLGSSYAYVGVTTASGGVGGVQNISNFTYQNGASGFTLAVVTNEAASEVQPTSATLNGEVLSNGGFAPTITFYYGTADGGTNAGDWAGSVTIGVENGNFSQAISGLLPNTTYYYTVQANNFAGTSWASPSFSFRTTAANTPQVANVPATGIEGTLATLNGQIISTGGAPTSATIYYGPTDGGTSASAWSNSLALGQQSGAYSATVGSLATNTTYYFTSAASNLAGVVWATPSLSFTTLVSNPVSTLTAVLTYHNDNTRWGVNSNETILTLANVNTNSFGKLFTYTVDGFVYAQPLVMTNVNIPGKGIHNVVYIADEHNSVYAFDADSNTGANASPLWKTSFLGPNVTTVPSGDTQTTDITPEVGITSTPVIDPNTGTIYLEVKTKENGTTYVHRLHALDITTGLEKTSFNSPVVIQCTNYPGIGQGGSDNDGENPPHVSWNPLKEHSRPALTLFNGVVYLSFASHGDNQPYHGWFFGYNATNLALQPQVYNSTPNGGLGGFWDGGGGPSIDAQGNMYLQTGNGTFDQITAVTSSNNYAMSIIKFSTTNGLQMTDFFAPSDAVNLSGGDQDLGSAAPIILPDSAGSAAHPHLVLGGGKSAPLYLVDRDNMSRWNATTDQIVQEWNGSAGGDRDTTPAFWNNTLYVYNGNIAAYYITNAQFNENPVQTPDGYNNKGGATACISVNGTSNAIMWALANSGADSPTTPCVLRAYNATNITQELYTSDTIPSRDSAGDAVKFTTPTIANGKVYVGAQYSLTVYGLASTFVNTPLISPNGGVFTNSVTVTLSDGTPGASIYYTLDGSTPTTNSFLYSEPFVLTNSTAVTADAFKPGAVPSGTATASFINSSAVGSGTGLLGQYWANTTSGAFLTPGFDNPPTLTRVDPTIDFDWNNSTPATNVGPDTFVVQWTGAVEPQFSETYTFSTTTDDGVLLYVNGQLLVNEWVDQGPTTWSGSINLVAQQRYNIVMDYYQNGGGAEAYLYWSSPSLGGAMTIIPESQLYPVTNPPPSVAIMSPSNDATYTASASVTISANAAAQYNPLAGVSFYLGSTLLGTVSNAPYSLTTTGLGAGTYTLTAVAVDGSGLSATSAPVNITVNPATGLPYGLTNLTSAPAFYNMPTVYTGTLPALLSQTGVFTNTPAMTPVASLIPYAPNVQLFSDNAQKIRYFSVPNTGAPLTASEQITYAPTNNWSFPAGTVFVKTFELQTNTSDPTSLLRLETRLLVLDTNGAVYGVTYKWRSDYSDADLLSSSQTEAIPIQTPGGVYTNLWYYPSPSDCLQCHTAVANYVLGANARQLNRTLTYSNGVTDNELRALNRAGLFNPAIDEATITNIEALSALTNLSASYQQRARSYLDANCAQCHQPGGTGPTFDARYDTPLAQQNIIGVPAVKGNLGYDHVDIVTPDDVWRSSLYDRMNVVNPLIQMPPLARNLIDTNAVEVMADWINSLPGTPALPPPTLNPAGGTFQGSVSVTLEDASNNAAIYYTLDGSLPTTSSTLYTGPFVITNTVTLNANAWESGYSNSVVGTALFVIQPNAYFTGAAGFSNGMFAMALSGPVGSNYVLEVSTNLQTWSALSTNTATNTNFTLTDPSTPSTTSRFYRVLQQP